MAEWPIGLAGLLLSVDSCSRTKCEGWRHEAEVAKEAVRSGLARLRGIATWPVLHQSTPAAQQTAELKG